MHWRLPTLTKWHQTFYWIVSENFWKSWRQNCSKLLVEVRKLNFSPHEMQQTHKIPQICLKPYLWRRLRNAIFRNFNLLNGVAWITPFNHIFIWSFLAKKDGHILMSCLCLWIKKKFIKHRHKLSNYVHNYIQIRIGFTKI